MPPCSSELKTTASRVAGDIALRGLLADCRRLLSERGEANSVAIARALVARFEALPDGRAARFFERLASDFSPDPAAVLEARAVLRAEPSADHMSRLAQVTEPPRQELLRRINRTPGGTAAIVRMRRALLERLERKPELRAVEADLLHLLSSWFNPGFLQLQPRRLELAGAVARADHPPRGGARDRRLGRPAPAPAARPALLRVLPSAARRTSR